VGRASQVLQVFSLGTASYPALNGEGVRIRIFEEFFEFFALCAEKGPGRATFSDSATVVAPLFSERVRDLFAGVEPEFLQDPADVGVHRSRGDGELLGDAAVGETARDERGDLCLSAGKGGRAASGLWGSRSPWLSAYS
jgi:hypothetical protein